jgi:riboflavin biosynthesis pyrimidine reductase
MVPSIDGRIVVDGWRLGRGIHAEYERTARTFRADAWIIGRISMEPYAGRARVPASRSRERIPRTDYVAPRDARTFAIAIDPSGKLRWRASDIDGEHVITVLTEAVSDRYLAFLRARGVSYLFGGKRTIDVARVLEKLRALFGIERVLLEGGGKINGTFHAADVVDELSVLVAPVVDGNTGPTLFDAPGVVPARAYRLLSATQRPSGVVWLRYRRAR